jgi:hypothetical protein
MAKYRRKVTVTEAVRFTGPTAHSAVKFDFATATHYVITAHGLKAYLNIGDWIIPESNGKGHYPITDEIFKATYEEADDTLL